MKHVLKVTGLFTFLAVAFLNTFVDLGHKIIIQNTVFKNYDGSELIVLSSLVNALILLPFILLFTPSGYLSDKYSKNKVMRVSAWFALAITLMITFGYYQGWFWFSFGMTFLLAMQSAFYSPAKYGFVKELVGERRLAQANGLVQATTTIGILMSTFFFSILFEKFIASHSSATHAAFTDKNSLIELIAPLGWMLVALTTIELILAYRLPEITHTNTRMRFHWNDYVRGKTQARNIRLVKRHPYIWLSILGLAVFWGISQVLLASYPAYAKEFLGITNTAQVQGMMAFAGIGVMMGSLFAGRVSKNHIETGLVPVGAIGITVAILLIRAFDSALLQSLNFLFLGIMGGFFVVPLNSLMQYHTRNNQLGRVLASNNLIQFSVMLTFLVITSFLSYINFNSVAILWGLALIAFAGTLYTIYRIPESLLRFIVARIFAARYRLRILGFEDLPASGGILLLGNHISFVDWALVQMACPRQLHFVIERGYYERWYLKGVLDMFGAIPINSAGSAESIDKIKQLLKDGKAVCLFPEGTISRTGQLSEFKRGYEKAIQGTRAKIVPFYLHGLWGSRFSRSSGFLKEARQSGFKRDIIVAFGKPLPGDTRAEALKRQVFDLSFASWQDYAKTLEPIPVAWLKTAKRMSFQMAAIDINGEPVSHHKFITAVFRFSRLIAKKSPEQNIGILVPSSVGGAITNMAVLALGKTAVNLNFTANSESLQGAVKKAEIQSLYTSRKFLNKLENRGLKIKELLPHTQLFYLEDFRTEIPKAKMLATLVMVMLLPTQLLQWLYIRRIHTNDTAAILFSSGSEGTPKGVELSHLNLASNSRQIADMINTRENDVVMSTLPTFHAFGLLATTLMPLMEGIPIVCHPDPTDVVNIAKGVARYKATFLFGTSTFLRLYTINSKVHPLMLSSLRLVIAGAERLNPETRTSFSLKFNKLIMEGYGTTETSPVASVNIPDELDTNYWKTQIGNKAGTVGMPLPGTSFKIVDPDILQELPTGEDGLILIGGPQVMKGYLHDPQKTKEVIEIIDDKRWYRTGDKGHLDTDSFLIIVDRYSRFAKLGGEMISLTSVEHQIRTAMQDAELELVTVNIPDNKKGEKIIALIATEIPPKEIRQKLIENEMSPLMIPAEIKPVNAIPRLGSGKTDYASARKVAMGEM